MTAQSNDFPIKVLIVDDTPANLKIMEVSISRDDSRLQILTAESGEKALEIVMEHELALVISDVFMSGMNGHQFVEFLHKNPKTRNIPVIFVTAGNMDLKMEEEGYRVGAVDYLYKPINYKVLRAKVKVFIDLYVLTKEIQSVKQGTVKTEGEKNSFIDIVSQEAMTPLNGIMGMCDALLGSSLTSEQRNFVGTIRSSSNSLFLLMRDMLDVANLGSGQLEINARSFSLAQFVTETSGMWGPRIEDKRVNFYMILGDNVFSQIVADRQRIEQILGHFLGNALKFTVRGSIEMNCHLEMGMNNSAELIISVTDTGSGISTFEMKNIFSFSTDSSPSSSFTSSRRQSIGLPLSNELAKLMEGEILVESKKGYGSTFTLKIPVKVDPLIKDRIIPPELKSRIERQGSNAQIVVKDEKEGQALASILKYYSINSTVSVGNSSAFAANEIAFVSEEMIDESEAVDVCKKSVIISRKGKDRKSVSAKQLKESGTPVLLQPCSLQYLTSILDKLFTATGISSIPRVTADRKKLAGKKILIVDHNPVSQRVHSLMLTEMGAIPTIALDSDTALRTISIQNAMDGVLIDCHFPVVDGMDLTTKTRIQEKTKGLKRIPIIGISSDNSFSFRQKCISVGMDEFITKPVNKFSLQAKLERLILPNS
jgi:CheY-like chemotaxis protein